MSVNTRSVAAPPEAVFDVLANGWLDVDEVLGTLAERPGTQHVVMTGRRMPQQVLDAADLVTEMTKLKHPFDTGAKGQAGIEW